MEQVDIKTIKVEGGEAEVEISGTFVVLASDVSSLARAIAEIIAKYRI